MDADLVTAWKAICQALGPAFTRPTFVTFLHIATGWVLCRSKPTVTSLVCTIGGSLLGHAAKHWTVYERFFYRTRWSLDDLSRLLLRRVVVPLIENHSAEGSERTVELVFDGTTCGRTGRQVAYAGYFKDASVGNTLQTVVHWSHNWVVGAVVLRPARWPNWVIALPVFFALYRKPADCDRAHRFATTQQLAARMIRQTREALPDWKIESSGDGQFACREVTRELDDRSDLVSRIRRDAALHDLPPRRRPRRRGRPAKKGKRLSTPQQMAARCQRGWRTVCVRKGGRTVKRRVLSRICLWYYVCRDQPIKVVIVRDPKGREDDDFFYCTDPEVSEERILERYYGRWSIEEAIHDGKQYGGFEQVQGWCPRTVTRQAPLALVIQTMVKAWYVVHGAKAKSAQPKGHEVCGWLAPKAHPSYLDMLATLRRVLWSDRISLKSIIGGAVRKTLRALQFTLCAAA
jgi:hypothetical protein